MHESPKGLCRPVVEVSSFYNPILMSLIGPCWKRSGYTRNRVQPMPIGGLYPLRLHHPIPPSYEIGAFVIKTDPLKLGRPRGVFWSSPFFHRLITMGAFRHLLLLHTTLLNERTKPFGPLLGVWLGPNIDILEGPMQMIPFLFDRFLSPSLKKSLPDERLSAPTWQRALQGRAWGWPPSDGRHRAHMWAWANPRAA